MKLAIHPLYVLTSILSIGITFSISRDFNPGYGMLGIWCPYLGLYGVILSLTKMHSIGEAKRTILKRQKPKRVLYRGIVIGLLSGLFHIPFVHNFSAIMLMVSILVLALSCAFLFGIFFDPWQNKARGLDRWHFGGQSDYDEWASKDPKKNFWFEVTGFVITWIASMVIMSSEYVKIF